MSLLPVAATPESTQQASHSYSKGFMTVFEENLKIVELQLDQEQNSFGNVKK
jgi:hypothetical protein